MLRRPLNSCTAQQLKQEAWSGPVSRILFRPCLRTIGEDHSSAARVTAAVKQPTRTLNWTRAGPLRPYLVLLRRGFAMPSTLTCDAVRSYRTVSPLPRQSCDRRSAVYFLLHFPSRHRAWPLASLLPVGVRTFLGIVVTPPRSSGPLHAATITDAAGKTSRHSTKTMPLNC